MKNHMPLHLYEEILLLALHDEKGTVHLGALFEQAAGGALLTELLLSGRLTVNGEKSKARVIVKDESPMGDPLLDECLERIAGDKKQRRPLEWVQKFITIKRLRHRVGARLVEKGILMQKQDKVLLFFPRTRYPESDSRPENEILQRIRQAVIGTSLKIEPRTIVLIALARHTGLLHRAVEKKKLKEHKKHIEKLIAGEIAGTVTLEAVKAMQAAVMVAAIMPAITSSASH